MTLWEALPKSSRQTHPNQAWCDPPSWRAYIQKCGIQGTTFRCSGEVVTASAKANWVCMHCSCFLPTTGCQWFFSEVKLMATNPVLWLNSPKRNKKKKTTGFICEIPHWERKNKNTLISSFREMFHNFRAYVYFLTQKKQNHGEGGKKVKEWF